MDRLAEQAGVKGGMEETGEERAALDERLKALSEELAERADAGTVAKAAAEVAEELERELRDRLEVALRRKEREQRQERRRAAEQAETQEEEFERFSLAFRLQHFLLLSSCIILIVTGIPLKFPYSAWSALFFRLMGGVHGSGIIHRIGASGLIGVGVVHLGYITLTKEGRREFKELLPKPKDVLDVIRNVLYFVGLRKSGARFGRFSYIEKFDYWAVYWGMVVMITSGLMLWFETQAMSFLPKYALDMAREAHSDEALLATLAIIIWHFYNVHLSPGNFPMNMTFWTGRISKEKMISHHPLEYEKRLAERAATGTRRPTVSEEGKGPA